MTRMTHETRISELQELFRPIAINGEIVDVLIMNVSFVFCGRLAQLLELKTIVCCGTLTFSSVYNNKITPPPFFYEKLLHFPKHLIENYRVFSSKSCTT